MSPPWMVTARKLIGTRETPGAKSNPTIMGWAKRLGTKVLGMLYSGDEVPWCGLFAAEVVASAGFTPPKIAVRAKAWATWGEDTIPCEGAVLVFERPGGGHVGFHAGRETATAYQVLGGNQSDAVTLAWIAKDRCVAVRWPPGYRPKGPRPQLASVGGMLSSDEA